MSGFETVKIGWYKLKGLWNKNEANAGLAAIEAERDRRAAAIAEAQGKIQELERKRNEIDIWQVKSNKKPLSDVFGGIKKGLGILPAGVPGMEASAEAAGPAASGSGASTASVDAVASGGKRSSVINIKLDSLVEKIVFEGGYESSREDMQRDLESALIRVLQMAHTAQ